MVWLARRTLGICICGSRHLGVSLLLPWLDSNEEKVKVAKGLYYKGVGPMFSNLLSQHLLLVLWSSHYPCRSDLQMPAVPQEKSEAFNNDIFSSETTYFLIPHEPLNLLPHPFRAGSISADVDPKSEMALQILPCG